MKKIAAILALLLVFVITDAQAGSLSYSDRMTNTSGITYDFCYEISSERGSGMDLLMHGNDLISIILNFPFASASGHVYHNFQTLALGTGIFEACYQAVASVPLPAALPMFGMALAGFGFYRRRKAAA